jgi:hypothetical protein
MWKIMDLKPELDSVLDWEGNAFWRFNNISFYSCLITGVEISDNPIKMATKNAVGLPQIAHAVIRWTTNVQMAG